MFSPSIAFIDLETTGTTATGDRITEIGIVRVEDGELAEEWSTLVNPERSIPEEIQALTGITNAMVRGAPTFAQVAREVLERLEGHLFVAHNARFDYGFIKNEFRRLETTFTADVLCTVRLSRRLYPDAVGHGLDALIARHGLNTGDRSGTYPEPGYGENQGPSRVGPRTGRHSALGDARVLWQFV
jgi:DNA polymerase-3 subunit epsilon